MKVKFRYLIWQTEEVEIPEKYKLFFQLIQKDIEERTEKEQTYLLSFVDEEDLIDYDDVGRKILGKDVHEVEILGVTE